MSEAIPKRCVIVSNWDVSCQFDWWSSAGMTIIRRIVWGLSNYHCMGSVRLWSWPAGPLPTLKVASTPIYYQWEAAAPTVHCVSSCANRRRMICQWCVDPGNGGRGAPVCRSLNYLSIRRRLWGKRGPEATGWCASRGEIEDLQNRPNWCHWSWLGVG